MEMDIYMRRRLVALGGLVAFFIVVVLLFRSCGGDDEPETTATPVGASGLTSAQPLPKEEYIASADGFCDEANTAISGIDPEEGDATQQELEVIEQLRINLDSLILEEPSKKVDRFKTALTDLAASLESKQLALDASDTAAEAATEEEITAAKAEAQEEAESYGFEECGQFGEPGTGETSSGGGSDAGTAGTEDTGGTVPVAPVEPAPTEPAPTEPAPTEPTAPPSDSGGIAVP